MVQVKNLAHLPKFFTFPNDTHFGKLKSKILASDYSYSAFNIFYHIFVFFI